MSLLTKVDLLAAVRDGRLQFTPQLDVFQVQAHAVDLRLGFTFLVPRYWVLNQRGRVALELDHATDEVPRFDVIELESGQVFDLLPGEFVLVSTLERICMPDDLVASMYPRSSVNRRGLAVDLSGIVDAGYEGNLIIPVRNNNRANVTRLYPGERFCQLTFTRLEEPVEVRKSRYHRRDIASGALPEQDLREVELIRAGNIQKLKDSYRVLEE